MIKKILLALVAALVFCELSLQAASLVVRSAHPASPAQPPADGSAFAICAGDSFTYGLGAPDNSYPKQLEGKVRGSVAAPTVVNLGYPGYNSSQTLAAVRDGVRSCRAGHIIVLTGLNNNWNPEGFDTEQPGPFAELLSRLRIVRMSRILWARTSSRPRPSPQPEVSPAAFHQSSPEIAALEKEMETHYLNAEYRETILLCRRILALDGCSFPARLELGRSYNALGDRELAKQLFLDGLRCRLDERALMVLFNELRDMTGRREFRRLVKTTVANSDPRIRDGLLRKAEMMFFNGRYAKLRQLRADLAAIAAIAAEKAMKPVFITYPHFQDDAFIISVNTVIRQEACRRNAVLIDAEKTFSSLLREDEANVRGLFVDDGHCSARGYALIAEEIRAKLAPYPQKTE